MELVVTVMCGDHVNQNRFDDLSSAALSLAQRVAEHKGVTGVFFLGGLARGFLDESSDLDIVVLLSKRDKRLKDRLEALGWMEKERTGVDVDLEVHSIDDFERLERDDCRRWESSHAVIVYDRDGRTRSLLSEISSVPDRFWTDRIVRDWAYLQWYADNPEAPKSIAESCMDRGDPMGAHYCVNYSVDLLVELVFALNKEFLPAQKWRMSYLERLGWRPPGMSEALHEALTVRRTDRRDLMRRLRALKRLRESVGSEVRAVTRLSDEDFWRHFIKVFVFEER